MTLRPRGPESEASLQAFERKHRVRLPAAYRDYMLAHGGGVPEANCYVDELRRVEVYVGIIYSLDAEVMADQLFGFGRPAETGFLVVAGNGGGDEFLLELGTGAVFYWDHERDDYHFKLEELLWLAPNFERLIVGLVHGPEDGPREPDEVEVIARCGDVARLEAFVAARGLRERSSLGLTLAEECARSGDLALVGRCVELGASLDNLLHLAAPGRNLELIEFLVDRGAGINGLNKKGESPLDRAFEPEIYEFLQRRGARHAKRQKPPHLF